MSERETQATQQSEYRLPLKTGVLALRPVTDRVHCTTACSLPPCSFSALVSCRSHPPERIKIRLITIDDRYFVSADAALARPVTNATRSPQLRSWLVLVLWVLLLLLLRHLLQSLLRLRHDELSQLQQRRMVGGGGCSGCVRRQSDCVCDGAYLSVCAQGMQQRMTVSVRQQRGQGRVGRGRRQRRRRGRGSCGSGDGLSQHEEARRRHHH